MIIFKNVKKEYKDTLALDDINFHIKKNQLTLLLGASGSGKSTILSLIAGFIKPTFGEIIVNGVKISKMNENFIPSFRRENIGFIFQNFNLIDDLSVFDNISLPLIPTNLNFSEIEKKADILLDKFNMANKKYLTVRKLSGGEQQRVAIMRSLITNPNILIADEPSANLDKKLVDEFNNILKTLKDNGKTIIIATHDKVFENLDFIDKKIILENGKIKI